MDETNEISPLSWYRLFEYYFIFSLLLEHKDGHLYGDCIKKNKNEKVLVYVKRLCKYGHG